MTVATPVNLIKSGQPQVDPVPLPAGYRVMLNCAIELHDQDQLEVRLTLTAKPTGDAFRDARAGLLSVFWLDESGNLIPNDTPGFVNSEPYGPFVYVAGGAADEAIQFYKPLRAPQACRRGVVRLIHFSNPTLTLVASLIQRTAGVR
jgi:hypothetical protein